MNLKYFLAVLIFVGFAGTAFLSTPVSGSEPQIISEDKPRGDAHPDSCTRWQQWDHGYCVDKTDFPAYVDALNFMKIITVPFVGAGSIFVVSTAPSVSKKKKVAMISPGIVLILLSPFVIFMGGLGFY